MWSGVEDESVVYCYTCTLRTHNTAKLIDHRIDSHFFSLTYLLQTMACIVHIYILDLL
jgi:hypothetical protein